MGWVGVLNSNHPGSSRTTESPIDNSLLGWLVGSDLFSLLRSTKITIMCYIIRELSTLSSLISIIYIMPTFQYSPVQARYLEIFFSAFFLLKFLTYLSIQ